MRRYIEGAKVAVFISLFVLLCGAAIYGCYALFISIVGDVAGAIKNG